MNKEEVTINISSWNKKSKISWTYRNKNWENNRCLLSLLDVTEE